MIPDVVDLYDCRMLQSRGDSGFRLEQLDLTRRAEQSRMRDLDRHGPPELVVASEVHVTEPAAAQQLHHRVAAEPLGERIRGCGPRPAIGSLVAREGRQGWGGQPRQSSLGGM